MVMGGNGVRMLWSMGVIVCDGREEQEYECDALHNTSNEMSCDGCCVNDG